MRRSVVLALAVLGLGGCAALRTTAPDAEVLSGRLSLRIAGDGGQPARQWSAGFELKGRAERGELQLLSPLGTVVAQARWNAEAAELWAQGTAQRFASLPELARQALGEPVPLQALPDWLRGRVWDGAPHTAHAQGFEQAGWRIDLAAQAQGLVVIQRDAAPAVTLRALLETSP